MPENHVGSPHVGSDASSDDHGRPVAPGGWRRGVIGLAVGIVAGVLVAMLQPREQINGRDPQAPRR